MQILPHTVSTSVTTTVGASGRVMVILTANMSGLWGVGGAAEILGWSKYRGCF